eukprot:NODE_2495_length_916_cov_89.627451_g2050_i0.p1 GENE.NODE_2495_length_916_cov_89.627451_g2050_i0~~NODE_2495_length_916_cov_89.627451_g2050_i0.p1  ORF type:complete len:277 (-),score=61.73 NODE_2495_length_916_cov_89.627451_g2050_i0:58-888(-)
MGSTDLVAEKQVPKQSPCRSRGVDPGFQAKHEMAVDIAEARSLARPLHFNTTFGYMPKRNLPRWRLILEGILKRHSTSERLAIIDYGSNAGFFSLALASTFPRSLIVSVDIMSCHVHDIIGNQGGMQVMAPRMHREKIHRLGVVNNVMCDSRLTPFTFSQLYKLELRLHYQLSLSVLHWLDIRGQSAFFKAFAHHIAAAETTFVEMPRPHEGVRRTDVLQWYRGLGDDPLALMRAAVAARLPHANVTFTLLLPGYRPLYRVDVVLPRAVRYPCEML